MERSLSNGLNMLPSRLALTRTGECIGTIVFLFDGERAIPLLHQAPDGRTRRYVQLPWTAFEQPTTHYVVSLPPGDLPVIDIQPVITEAHDQPTPPAELTLMKWPHWN